MSERLPLTDQVRHLFYRATDEARRLGYSSACAAHVLMCVSNKPPTMAAYILDDIGVRIHELRASLELGLLGLNRSELPLNGLRKLKDGSRLWAARLGEKFVCTEHVLLAALDTSESVIGGAFDRLGVPVEAALARAQVIAAGVAKGKGGPSN